MACLRLPRLSMRLLITDLFSQRSQLVRHDRACDGFGRDAFDYASGLKYVAGFLYARLRHEGPAIFKQID